MVNKIALLAMAFVLGTASMGMAMQGQGVPFEKMDKDANGAITVSEFVEHHKNKKDAEKIFAQADTNADGAITKQEWSEFLQKTMEMKGKKK